MTRVEISTRRIRCWGSRFAGFAQLAIGCRWSGLSRRRAISGRRRVGAVSRYRSTLEHQERRLAVLHRRPQGLAAIRRSIRSTPPTSTSSRWPGVSRPTTSARVRNTSWKARRSMVNGIGLHHRRLAPLGRRARRENRRTEMGLQHAMKASARRSRRASFPAAACPTGPTARATIASSTSPPAIAWWN